jgi:hypothetical protein
MSSHRGGKFDRETVERAVAFIQRRYGSGCGVAFEAETGISSETFRKWRDGTSAPSWRHALTMILVFGPAFLEATCEKAPRWLCEAARKEAAEKLKEQIAADQRRLEELTSL